MLRGKKLLIIASAITVFCFLSYVKFYYYDLMAFRPQWLLCMRYLDIGTLYCGQPYCLQAPFFFLYLSLIRTIFGFDYIVLATTAINIVINVLILFFIILIIQKQLNTERFIMILLLYSTLIYYPITSWMPAVSLSALFVLSGYYLLFFKRTGTIAAGILFSLAVYTKLIVIPAIMIILGYYLLRKRALLSLCLILIIILLPAIILHLSYPAALDYVMSSSRQRAFPLDEAISGIVTEKLPDLTVPNITVNLVILFSFFLLIRKRSINSFLSFFGLLAVYIVINKALFLYSETHKYYALYYVFFILLLIETLQSIGRSRNRVAYVSIIVLLFILPGSYLILHDNEYVKLICEANPLLKEVPSQEGLVLGEAYSSEYFRLQYNDIPYHYPKKLDVLHDPIPYDPFHILGFLATGIIRMGQIETHNYFHPSFSSSFWDPTKFEGDHAIDVQGFDIPMDSFIRNHENDIYSRIHNGTYDLIVIGPAHWEGLVRLAKNYTNTSSIKGYCKYHSHDFL
jgi:hypothetical protein